MKLALAAACLVANLSLATVALADGQTIATLQAPVAKPSQFVVNNALWNCSGTSCVSNSAQDMYFGPGECHSIGLKAHVAVVDFKSDAKTLQPASLDQCNAGLAPKTSVASAH
jgi:hypothetical protein